MVNKDLIKIEAKNSFGDCSEEFLENPTCSEVLEHFVTTARLLGFSNGQIYSAIMDNAESVKKQIRTF